MFRKFGYKKCSCIIKYFIYDCIKMSLNIKVDFERKEMLIELENVKEKKILFDHA